jgi:anti-sigma factor RsiW
MNHLSDDLLNEYLDNALSDRTPVDDHLAHCTECATRLTALQALFTRIESLPEVRLSRDLAAPVMRRVTGPFVFPRWLTLTAALQAVLALIAVRVAAPFVIEFASSSMPALQTPSLTGTFIQLQSQWVRWLDVLSQIGMPAIPEIPVVEVSSLYFLLTVAGVSMFWLVGNGLLLRNQIR